MTEGEKDAPAAGDDSDTKTPPPTAHEFQRSRNMRKLARMLGESEMDLVIQNEGVQETIRAEAAVSAAETPETTECQPQLRVPTVPRACPEFVYSIIAVAGACRGASLSAGCPAPADERPRGRHRAETRAHVPRALEEAASQLVVQWSKRELAGAHAQARAVVLPEEPVHRCYPRA